MTITEVHSKFAACRRLRIRLGMAAGILALSGSAFAAPVHAQAYPNRALRMVVPWPAGGATDSVARKLADALGKKFGQAIIVENVGGANAILGTGKVARAEPDGYTLMFSEITSHASNPALQKSLPYDTAKDFIPVAEVAVVPLVLVANPDFPAKSVGDLIKMAKAKPNSIDCASFGIGSMSHLAAVLFDMMAGTKMMYIPYKGGSAGLTATISGQVGVYFSSVTGALPFIKAHKLRALGVTTSTRLKSLPEVPAIAETPGMAGYEASMIFAVWLPARTPQKIVDTLHRAIVDIVETPEFRQYVESNGDGVPAAPNTPAKMAATIHEDIAKLAKIIQTANIPKE